MEVVALLAGALIIVALLIRAAVRWWLRTHPQPLDQKIYKLTLIDPPSRKRKR